MNFIKDILFEIKKNIKLISLDNKSKYKNHIRIENKEIDLNNLIEENEKEILNFFINHFISFKNENINNPNINLNDIDNPNIAKMIKYIADKLKIKNKESFDLCVNDLRSMYAYYDNDNEIKNLKLKSLIALNLFFENTKVEKLNKIIESNKPEKVRLLSILFWGTYNGFTKIDRETFKIAVGNDFFN